MLLGLVCAGAATLLFNVGAALQAFAARSRPRAEHMRWLLLWRLAHQRWWLTGMVLSALGFPLQVLALAHAPLAVVQPVISSGLLVLLGLCVWLLRERLGPREWAGVGAIVLGLALLVVRAPSQAAHVSGLAPTLLVLATLVAITAAAVYGPGRRRELRAPAIWGSGAMLAGSGIATKAFSDTMARGDFAAAVLWLALAAGTGAFALLLQMSAIQRSRADRVFPVGVALQTALPVLLSPLYLAGSAAGWHGAVLVGLVVVVGGLVVVASSGSVSELAGAGARPALAVED